MSYTLITLKAARDALLKNDKAEALRNINCLVDRMETIISTRKSWRPTCLQTEKENEDGDNRSTATGKSKPLGGIGHIGPTGFFPLAEQLRSMVGENEARPDDGTDDKEHNGGESS